MSQNSTPNDPLKFRLGFILFPLICLLTVIAMSAVFYGQLPDTVYYRFNMDGDPSGSPLAKGSFLILMIGLQALLTFIAYFTTSAIGNIQTIRDNVDKFLFSPTRLLKLIGNMPAIIQVILAYLFVDAIVYSKQTDHIMPLWVFAIGTLVIGGIIVLIYGLPMALRGYKGITGVQEKKKEK